MLTSFFSDGAGSMSMSRLCLFIATIFIFPPLGYVIVTTGKIPSGTLELAVLYGVIVTGKTIQNSQEK